jgi:aminoglycoside phosphotransferase (APT) family kinase protein
MESTNEIFARLQGLNIPGMEDFTLRSVEQQQGGLFNHVLRIDTDRGQWFTKQYTDRNVSTVFNPPRIPKENRATLAYEIQALAARLDAEEQGVPAVYFEQAHCTLWIKGVASPRPLIDFLSTGSAPLEAMRTVGRVLGRLHQQTFGQAHLIDNPHYRNEEFRDFKLGLQYLRLAEQIPEHMRQPVIDLVEDYRRSQVAVLHGDINSRNIVVGLGNPAPVGVIDFEQSHVGHPAYDLSYFLSELVIALLFFRSESHVLRLAIDAFLREYFKYFNRISIPDLMLKTMPHLAVQIAYRFLGPSKNSWTFYVKEEERRDEILAWSYKLFFDPCWWNAFDLEFSISNHYGSGDRAAMANKSRI